VLRFKIDRPLPPELAGKARVTGRIVQLPAHDAHEIERYLAIIRQAGLTVEDVEVRKADLEDVFLDVMSKHGEKPDAGAPREGARPPSGGTALDGEATLEAGSS
jgi:ABC-2 type transport system ATP-binding protein